MYKFKGVINLNRKTIEITAVILAVILGFPTKVYAEPILKIGVHTAYISGYPDGTIRPEAYVTREEAAAVFAKISNYKLKPSDIQFEDVPKTRWSYNCIMTLASNGIIKGGGGKFRPTERITRAEMAVLASKTAKSRNGYMTFSDMNGHWAEAAVSAAASDGWIAGYSDGEFKPEGFVTRAEMVFMINRVLKRKPNENVKTGPLWSDNSNIEKWYYLDIQEASA